MFNVRRGLVVAALAGVSMLAAAAAPQRALPPHAAELDADSLLLIASWLRQQGRDGYIGGDVADAMGIPRLEGGEPMAARQRGFRSDDVLRVAQVSADAAKDFILFMVQRPDDLVYFYMSTPSGGLQKAFMSIPSKNLVMQLERADAEQHWRAEVQYWKDRAR